MLRDACLFWCPDRSNGTRLADWPRLRALKHMQVQGTHAVGVHALDKIGCLNELSCLNVQKNLMRTLSSNSKI